MRPERKSKTLLEVARSIPIRCATAQEFLERQGIAGYRPDSELPQPVVDLLMREFRPNWSVRDRFVAGVRRALAGVARTEQRLRSLALSVRPPTARVELQEEAESFPPALAAGTEVGETVEAAPSREEAETEDGEATIPVQDEVQSESDGGAELRLEPPSDLVAAEFAPPSEPTPDADGGGSESAVEDTWFSSEVEDSTPAEQLSADKPGPVPPETRGAGQEQEENEEFVEQLDTLEEILCRMSQLRGQRDASKSSRDRDRPEPEAGRASHLESVPDESYPVDETDTSATDRGTPPAEPITPSDTPGETEGPPEIWPLGEAEPPEQPMMEADEEVDSLEFFRDDVDEEAREEFLDESLRQLETLLSELGSEPLAGPAGKEPVPTEGPSGFPPDTSETASPSGAPPPELIPPAMSKRPEPPLAAPRAGPGKRIGGPQTQTPKEEKRRTPAPAGGAKGGEEPESLVSDLLDLSALLRELPGVDERAPEEVPPAREQEPEPPEEEARPVAQPRIAHHPIRKWIRRSLIPQARSAGSATRQTFRQLAPVQRRLLVGFLVLIGASIVGAVGWHLWAHRPGGDVGLWHSGQELLAEGRPDLARKEFAKLVQRYPESPFLRRSMYLLGECLYRQGSYGAALNTFLKVRKLLAAQPQEIDGLLYPDFTFRDQGELRIADCYVQEGRFEEGVGIYEAVIARDERAPVASSAALARAAAFLAWGDREGSPAAYRRAAQAFTLYGERYPQGESPARRHRQTALAFRGLARTDQENAREHLLDAAAELERARDLKEDVQSWEADARARLALDLAETYFQLSQWPEAIAAYEEVLALGEPTELIGTARIGRTRALLESGQFEAAYAAASEAIDAAASLDRRAEALFSKGDAAWELRRYDEMLAAYDEALRLSSADDFPPEYAERAHMRITNVLFVQEKRYAEAAERYQRIVSRFPDGPYTHLALYRLGCSLIELGRYAEAADTFRRSIQDYPRFEHRDPDLLVDAYYRTAECHMRTGSWSQAVEALKAALQDLGFPEDERGRQARVDLAACYAALSVYDRAIAILEGYREKFPEGDPDGAISMRLGEYYRARFDFASARALHQRIAREHEGEPLGIDATLEEGKDLVAQAAAAPAEEKLALHSAALLRFEKARQARPDDPEPLLHIARLYHSQRDFSAAKVYLGRYFDLSPEGPEVAEARFLAGQTAYSLGEFGAAVQHFAGLDPAGLAEPVIAQASYEHADACRELGETERAVALFRETARLFPSTEWGREARWKLDHMAWQERLAQSPVN